MSETPEKQQINIPEQDNSDKFAEYERKDAKLNAIQLMDLAKFYALPLFSILFFLGLIFFAVIPDIRYTFDTLDEIDSIRSQDEELKLRIDRLNTLREENVRRAELIQKINDIVPTGKSQVVNFRERVKGITVEQALVLETSESGETIVESEVVTTVSSTGNATGGAVGSPEDEARKIDSQFNLIQIPSEFNISGNFIDFRRFLIDMYDGQDFFIVEEMALNASPKEDNANAWFGTFNLTKYQFFAGDLFQPQEAFAAISELEQPDELVINFLETQFIRD